MNTKKQRGEAIVALLVIIILCFIFLVPTRKERDLTCQVKYKHILALIYFDFNKWDCVVELPNGNILLANELDYQAKEVWVNIQDAK